jgi:hypothetical protein
VSAEGRRTLATSSRDTDRRQRPSSQSPRLLSVQSQAVLPAPTGCPQPCSPSLSSWCFWEVGATLRTPAPRLGSEGRELAVLAAPLRTLHWAFVPGQGCCVAQAPLQPHLVGTCDVFSILASKCSEQLLE